jgi:hypothetical protein
MKSGKTRWAALVITLTLVAFALRVPGLKWGMPSIARYNSDNEHYVADAVRMAAEGDPNPRWFGHPGSTVLYPLALTFALTNRVDRALGSTSGYLGDLFVLDPTPYYALGRVYAALVGTALVPVTFALGRRGAGSLAGSLAVLPLAHLARRAPGKGRPDLRAGWIKPAAALALAGALVALAKGRAIPGLYALTSLLFLAFMSVHPLHWNRWVLPALPLLAALAGGGARWLVSLLPRRPLARATLLIPLVVLVAADVGMMAYRDVKYDVERLLPDTRRLAQAWLDAHLPPEASLVAEMYSVPLFPERFSRVEWVYAVGEARPERYREEGLDYAVFSRHVLARYEAEPQRYAEVLGNYRALQEEGELLYVARGIPWKVAGPDIYVYRLPREE